MHSAVLADGADPAVSNATVVHEQVGNATRESDISLTFTVDKERLANLSTLPFQVCLQNGHSSPFSLRKDTLFFVTVRRYIVR